MPVSFAEILKADIIQASSKMSISEYQQNVGSTTISIWLLLHLRFLAKINNFNLFQGYFRTKVSADYCEPPPEPPPATRIEGKWT